MIVVSEVFFVPPALSRLAPEAPTPRISLSAAWSSDAAFAEALSVDAPVAAATLEALASFFTDSALRSAPATLSAAATFLFPFEAFVPDPAAAFEARSSPFAVAVSAVSGIPDSIVVLIFSD